jgi:hypothetical protein
LRRNGVPENPVTNVIQLDNQNRPQLAQVGRQLLDVIAAAQLTTIVMDLNRLARRCRRPGREPTSAASDLHGGERNVASKCALTLMSSAEKKAEKIAKPLVRAINIYCSLTKEGLDDRMRRELARHIKGLAEQGVQDQSRLTVHGLSYLQKRGQNSRRG